MSWSTINRLVDLVEEIGGVKLKRRYDLSAPKGVNGRNSDNMLIQSVFRLGTFHAFARRPRGNVSMDLRSNDAASARIRIS